eukprot:69197-Rhodomonas_salina.1
MAFFVVQHVQGAVCWVQREWVSSERVSGHAVFAADSGGGGDATAADADHYARTSADTDDTTAAADKADNNDNADHVLTMLPLPITMKMLTTMPTMKMPTPMTTPTMPTMAGMGRTWAIRALRLQSSIPTRVNVSVKSAPLIARSIGLHFVSRFAIEVRDWLDIHAPGDRRTRAREMEEDK